jgi:integrase
MPVELTDAMLRALVPPTRGRIELRDTVVPGLVLRITPASIMTWSARAWTHEGKRTRPTIGTWPKVGITQARKRARSLLGKIVDGEDPAEEKRAARAERQARAALPTVAAGLAEWRNVRAASWSPRYAGEIERLCAKLIEPVLGKKALAETTRQDWVGLIARHRVERPATATWLYQLASSFLNYSEAHGAIMVPLLPRKGLAVIAPKAAPRQHLLDDDELRRIWLASENLGAKPRCFTKLLIMTAARRSEAAGIAMGELDLAAARWTIPGERAKNGRSITLPLHPLLLAELAAVIPDPAPHAEHRLLGRFRGSALSGISGIKKLLDRHSGVSGWTMHDLRRCARSTMSRLGVPETHAEHALNHVTGSALARTYNVHDYADEIIAALGRWQAHVAGIVSDRAPDGAKVVALRRA